MIPTTRHQFSNGLTLLLLESHQAPVVSINICLRVGSRFEADHEAGICHLIEHMLFKGTKKLKPGDVARKIEAGGGDVNAYTSFDETVYYCTISSRFTDRGLEVLSDAVLNSTITQIELDREREVVIEEILRSKDNPSRVLSEKIFDKAYARHNYGRPIIGFDKTVRGFSRKKIYDFYRRWYVPENMVVSLAGDFDSKKMFKRCESIFGRLRKKPSPRRKVLAENPQKKTRLVNLRNPIQGSSMALAYHVPELDHPDIPALDILSHILGEGESSRLDIRVKEKRGLVNSVYSYVYTPRDPGLFLVSYSLPEKNVPQATRAIFEEIEGMKFDKIDHESLGRAKLNIKSDATYEKETVEGLARKYGYFENILGRYDFEDHYYQNIDNVTPEDVNRVAEKYLHNKNLTMGLITPKDSKKKYKNSELLKCLPKSKAKRQKLPTKKEEVRHLRLANGLRLIFRENHHVPTIVIRTANLGGIRAENKKTNGIHSLLAHVWGKSTQSLDSHQMATQIENIAGGIDSYTGRNLTGMKADFLSEKTPEGVSLFLDAFLNPRLDRAEISREKSHQMEAIRREKDALANLAFKQFLKALYPSHPYGMPILGEKKLVRSFSKKEITKTYEDLLNPAQGVIAVVGDFDTEYMIDKMAPALEKIRKSAKRFKAPKADPAPKHSQRFDKILEKFQAHIVYGFRGVRLSDPDRYALDVLNNILAGQGGRLFLELRDKMSLAYSVTSLSQEGVEPGYFGVYIATEGSKTEKAIAGIERELNKIQKQPVQPVELNRAIQYMVGAYEIELQRNAAIATQLAFNEVYGVSREEWRILPDKIMKVTREDVLHVAQKILQMNHHILSLVRPKL